ncbi:Male sterility, NAD-binding [Pleurostoma richardsiae]|uniref:Male sterility, NAD-binding n=1 Tax=Pleurostoma richardsiae TaxID=41990 RepID=A0AA38VF77_9PEZI|nr:Male sterility, NAD-binding [Pleurostoma richardsiae]
MAIGAVVDAQDLDDAMGKSVSLATAWKNEEAEAELGRIIQEFPEAYIAVSYDHNRATVTTAKSSLLSLKDKLSAAGITANEIGLHGRFHNRLHEADFETLLQFCHDYPSFQLPDVTSMVLPIHMATGDNISTTQSGRGLHEDALRAILMDHSNWIETFEGAISSLPNGTDLHVISFGPERCVPSTVLKKLQSRVIHFGELDGQPESTGANDIAVIGMACKVAGASDLESFWDILAEGKSQHKEISNNPRFGFQTAFRPEPDNSRKWFANLIDDYDAFDHKFFKKTPREAVSMDPQQRLLLQNAYQAVTMSGYFQKPRSEQERQIGVFIGTNATDYENNVSHHPPNAFSATGNLRSFIAGKISHYFGWTGPGLTIDTACSASAVAIHQACQAILNGDCSAALAGGTNFISSPLWFQNLAAASFLSPTGQCKPFDAKADGYCRGEAIATVLLKKMSRAVADGDQIFGVIPGTAVYQNENCTPIFVPNVPSLSHLFKTVIKKSGLAPNQITYVEAHGTGTPVGDPAEYESIRSAFSSTAKGDNASSSPIQFGSVKGLVGHTEGSSGVVSLIKVLLMIHQQTIPPQASFDTMNPSINVSASDMMQIVKKAIPWQASCKAALINNYGASGSNASMIVKQAPRLGPSRSNDVTASSAFSKLPFWISGIDEKSIRSYAKRLRQFVAQKRAVAAKDFSLQDLSFNMARQSNWSLETAFIFTSKSLDEFDQSLADIEDDKSKLITLPAPRPVILCFGGQISTFVGLDRQVYDGCRVLRNYLKKCDRVCRSIGARSIFPGIFQREPFQNPSELQPILFSMQYACAMSWIESGVQPVAVLGHSFGELTALCVSGALGLEDSLRMVFGRSKIIRDSWGADKGAMMAVEADLQDVQNIVKAAGGAASIACFNGPRSFTVAGSTTSIDAVESAISSRQDGVVIKYKRLNVTNAFHSPLVDNLKTDLQKLGHSLSFTSSEIPLERATRNHQTEQPTSAYVADHMRDPVYFSHAAQRLEALYPSAVWLEAGSNSTITNMASRALNTPKAHNFVPVNITSGQGPQQLTDMTMSLWKTGTRAHFWLHAKSHSYEYASLILPPYQFDKQRHWLEFKAPPKQILSHIDVPESQTKMLYTFLGYKDNKQDYACFRINTEMQKYQDIVAGHVIARTAPICPATLQIDLAVEAIMSVHPEIAREGLQPQIRDVSNQSPICVNPMRTVYLEFKPISATSHAWSFRIFSNNAQDGSAAVTHVIGAVYFQDPKNVQYRTEFDRLERLVSHQRCLDLLHSHDADDVIQGRSIYKVFSDVVDYGSAFFGLQKLVGRRSESAGRVVRRRSRETWLDPLLGDCFSQVGGIWVNCIANQNDQDMFIANGFEQWTKSPRMTKAEQEDGDQLHSWNILAQHSRDASGNSFLTDIFVFEDVSGSLVEVILGINYARVSKLSMSKLLARLSPGRSSPSITEDSTPVVHPSPHSQSNVVASIAPIGTTTSADLPDAPNEKHPDLLGKLKVVLAEISGLEPGEIRDDTDLADIGIDSLMGMEMARDIESTFSCSLNTDDLMHVVDLPGLLACLRSALGVTDEDGGDSRGTSSASSTSDNKTSKDGQDTTTESSISSGIGTPPSTHISAVTEPGVSNGINGSQTPAPLELPSSAILEAFGESKARTDHFIEDHRCSGYLENVMPKQANLCVALTVESFKALGCDLAAAVSGQELQRVPHVSQHGRLCEYLYRLLEETRIVDLVDGRIVRTGIATPSKSSEAILEDLLREFPDHRYANQLTHWTGSHIADILSGKADGIKLIFGNENGRDLVAGLYGDSLLNRLSYQQMSDFLRRLTEKISKPEWNGGTLNILEMGAGTGGTTKWLVPMLAKLGFPVQYTFTDLSPSFVAAARKRFKEYPFMKFAVHDIEKPPSDPQLFGSQHIVIASNAIHATHSLVDSARNIHKFLRPDGFLMMLEMTETLYWVDIIFGILEGWWLFDDGRTHAIANERHWERVLQSVGFGHVDWTDGQSPEVGIQKIFIALASGPRLNLLPASSSPTAAKVPAVNHTSRREAVERYVETASKDFSVPETTPGSKHSSSYSAAKSVLVTGATGSLGSHLVMHLASLPDVQSVYCLNRRSNMDPATRQLQALESKGIIADAPTISKLKVLEVDTAKPLLDLPQEQYDELVENVTHIIHNAWPMSGKRPIKGFESQFKTMRNLVDLAAAVSANRQPLDQKVTFQLISSIATVGHYPLHKGTPEIPEERMTIDSVLPNGYGDAKFVCERILDETLHRHPDLFRPMVVRLGQVAGSSVSGYWNHMEHFSFMVKSAQTLRALPDLAGPVSWTPVNDVAGTCGDLLFYDGEPFPVYHIDSRLKKSWKEMICVFAKALEIPMERVIPFREWTRRVRAYPGEDERDNPAAKLVDFLEQDFERMSCGGILLRTEHSCEHSETLRKAHEEGVSDGVVRKYINAWRVSGFLR